MNTYALIKTGKVVDLIVADAAFLAAVPAWWTAQWDEIVLVGAGPASPLPVGVGSTYSGLVFSPAPDPDPP